ncbi:hypothetical protein [Nocardia sp. NPDC051570]|uniref:hypothetical protein n=1 Tax=Nocardia sp. NPDC051570 TaxID=3364324 RepID=UPI00379DF277
MELDYGTQVFRSDDAARLGRIVAVPIDAASDCYGVEWPDGAVETPCRATTDPMHTDRTVDISEVEIPIAAPGSCEHTFTVCADCHGQWAGDYLFLSSWPRDWSPRPDCTDVSR